MRNTNKKGFTIVELVIVVAVIAILAAVLIPTFSGIIGRANQSADQQAVANMNKLLATEIEEKAETADEVVEILIANGYNGDLSTYFKGYKLAFIASENVIVLVENGEVVYPKANAGATTGFEIINPMANDASGLTGATEDKTLFVGKDIKLEGATMISTPTKFNLNGHTVSSENNDNSGASKYSTLTIAADSTISGNGTVKNTEGYAITVALGATLTIKDGTFIGADAAVYVHGGSGPSYLVIEGGHFEVLGDDARYVVNCQDNTGSVITVKGGTFVNFNPDEPPCGAREVVVPDGYKVVSETQANGDVWYTVVAE